MSLQIQSVQGTETMLNMEYLSDIVLKLTRFLLQQKQQRMLRKKNYKQEDHFNHYHSTCILRSNGTKFTLYFKRYRPAQAEISLYDVLHSKNRKQIDTKSPYPIDRTLQVISFDGKLDISIPFFKKIGKIRKYVSGQTKYANRDAYYCIIIFKYQFDLVKCFRDEYFQELINRENNEGRADQEQKEAYKAEIIANYMGEQLKQIEKLEQLHKEGYNVVTNKLGEFKFDYEANQREVQELPQVRRRKKQEAKAKLIKNVAEQQ